MEFSEAKKHFISTWGELGMNWGINRTMGHIHALLLISPKPLCAEDIINQLQISKGNANMNLRGLLDWRLIYRQSKAGDRKDYFVAEKELWKVFRKTLEKRKQKELNPMLDMIKKISNVQGDSEDSNEFNRFIKDLDAISSAADNALDRLITSDSNIFLNTLVKIMR
ncbi:GbsR/MarR family transcriptional regulator [Maribacter sp.]|uniref:GbsR/MarR family transcriptional regulator n=1 Tax=Maribacter sp. TaxID=1897614 RepID=UPI0025C0A365|nr:transcriptional regulator [Maribacter sp.]